MVEEKEEEKKKEEEEKEEEVTFFCCPSASIPPLGRLCVRRETLEYSLDLVLFFDTDWLP